MTGGARHGGWEGLWGHHRDLLLLAPCAQQPVREQTFVQPHPAPFTTHQGAPLPFSEQRRRSPGSWDPHGACVLPTLCLARVSQASGGEGNLIFALDLLCGLERLA